MKLHSYRYCLLTFSSQVVVKFHINLNKSADLLSVHDLLLPHGIKGLNSHKSHSMISTLIMASINYCHYVQFVQKVTFEPLMDSKQNHC